MLLEYVIKWEFRGFRSDTKTGVLVTVLMSVVGLVAGLVLGALRTSALCCNKDVNYKLEQPRAAEQLLMSAYHTHTHTQWEWVCRAEDRERNAARNCCLMELAAGAADALLLLPLLPPDAMGARALGVYVDW